MQISTGKVNFSSLSEALIHFGLSDLVLFRLIGDALYNPETEEHYALEHVQIIQTLNFKDHSTSNRLLHLIRTVDGIEGCFIDAQGLYGDLVSMEDDHMIW